MNQYPSTPLWEKSFKKDLEEWVDRQLVIGQYDDIKSATRQILILCKGRMNPTFIIQAWRKRESERCVSHSSEVVERSM